MTNSMTPASGSRASSTPAQKCVAAGIKLPLRLCDESIGVILDADGADVLTVDIDRAMEDEAAAEIARWIVTHHKHQLRRPGGRNGLWEHGLMGSNTNTYQRFRPGAGKGAPKSLATMSRQPDATSIPATALGERAELS